MEDSLLIIGKLNMLEDLDHFSEYEWPCAVWVPDEPDIKFRSVVSYSLRSGLRIEALGGNEVLAVFSKKVLMGESYDLGRFTLYGCTKLGESIRQINQYRYIKVNLFATLFVVDRYGESEGLFQGVRFSTTDLELFCDENKDISKRSSSSENFLVGKYKDLNLSLDRFSVGEYARVERFTDHLIFVGDDTNVHDDSLERVNLKIREALDEEGLIPCLKGKSSFNFSLSTEGLPKKARHFTQSISDLTSLMSVFHLKPCAPNNVELFSYSSEIGYSGIKEYFPVLMSLCITDSEAAEINGRPWDEYLNISSNDIETNFQAILDFWSELSGSALDLTLNVINKHFKSGYNSVQHAVVCIAALEQWFNDHEQSEEGMKKYDFMLNKYATEYMLDKLREEIPLKIKEGESLGKKITDIRSVVLHPVAGKSQPMKEGRSFDEATFRNLSEIFIMVLIKAIYTKFGVSDEIVKKFGSARLTTLHEHHVLDGQ